MAYRKIDTTLALSGISIIPILHKRLTIKNFFWHWIPHNLWIVHEKTRSCWCRNAQKIQKRCSKTRLWHRDRRWILFIPVCKKHIGKFFPGTFIALIFVQNSDVTHFLNSPCNFCKMQTLSETIFTGEKVPRRDLDRK